MNKNKKEPVTVIYCLSYQQNTENTHLVEGMDLDRNILIKGLYCSTTAILASSSQEQGDELLENVELLFAKDFDVKSAKDMYEDVLREREICTRGMNGKPLSTTVGQDIIHKIAVRNKILALKNQSKSTVSK